MSAAASTTVWPSPVSRCATLAMVVVLPDAVDAHEHPHVGLARGVGERARLVAAIGTAGEERDQLGVQQRHERVGVGGALGLGPLLHVAEDPFGDGHADVGHQQRVFEVVPGLVVDAVAPAQSRERRRGSCPGAPGARARPRAPARRPAQPRPARGDVGGEVFGGAVGVGRVRTSPGTCSWRFARRESPRPRPISTPASRKMMMTTTVASIRMVDPFRRPAMRLRVPTASPSGGGYAVWPTRTARRCRLRRARP